MALLPPTWLDHAFATLLSMSFLLSSCGPKEKSSAANLRDRRAQLSNTICAQFIALSHTTRDERRSFSNRGEVATVDRNAMTGDIGRCIAAKEDRNPTDVAFLAETALWYLVEHP